MPAVTSGGDFQVRTPATVCTLLVLGLGASTCTRTQDSRTGEGAQHLAVDSGRVPVDGSSLFYEAAGQGAPVILLHAAYLDRRMWDDQFLELA